MHGIDLKTQMDIVYHALNDTSKGIIDASCCGAFKRKSAEEARDLIEDLTKCNMKAPCGTPTSAANPTYSDFWWTPGLGRQPYPLRDLPHFHGSPRTWDLGLKHQILTKWVPSWYPLRKNLVLKP